MTGCCDKPSAPPDIIDDPASQEGGGGRVDPTCCQGSVCGCDDSCFDELARVICADDDGHIHGNIETASTTTAGNDKSDQASVSNCSCCSEKVNAPVDSVTAPAATPTACQPSGLRKRASLNRPKHSPEPCGEHRTIARTRYSETLSAFGCVCKALLARGLKSCCNPPGLSGASIHSHNKHRPRRDSSHGLMRSPTPRSSASCCSKGSCHALSTEVPFRGHTTGVAASVKSESRLSVASSCCGDGCCGGGESVHSEKRANIVIDMSKKTGDIPGEGHVVLAIKGMTCTGCENKLIRTLRDIPAIVNPKTSLVLCRAEFDVDIEATDMDALVKLIEHRSGFEAEVIKAASSCDLRFMFVKDLKEKLLATPFPNGVEVVRVDKDGTAAVTYDPTLIGARKVLEYYASFSPILAPKPSDPALAAGKKHIRAMALRTVLSTALTIPVLIMTWAPLPTHPRAYGIACLVLATIVQVAVGRPFYINAFKSLVFSRVAETDLLIVLSTTAAYVYSVVAFGFDVAGRPISTAGSDSSSFFETSTLLVTLITVGQLISAIARQNAIEAISIRSLQQDTAILVHSDGTEEEVDARLLHYDDIFKVLPDTSIITDGVVISGASDVDESMMTGEARPVTKTIGTPVVAGTVNGQSPLVVKVTRLPGANTISDIARMVDDARFSRARVQETVDRVCAMFVPVVLVLTTITFLVWLAVGIRVRGQPAREAAVNALTYAIAVLAISCPCAIGLAVPMVILVAGGVGAKLGIVFKAATTLEGARKVDHVVLDKTGTVTEGKLAVVEHFYADVEGHTTRDLRKAIAELVASSRHPVARAVDAFVAGSSADLDGPSTVEEVEMVTGMGIQGTFLGKQLRGGSPRWLQGEDHPEVRALLAQGHTMFCVSLDGSVVAAFALSDTLRPEACGVITTLIARNIRVSILSGDHPTAVLAVAARLGVPEGQVRAGCLPADKQAYVKALAAAGETVLFCGDGTNDAVALAEAAVGVHLRSGGGAAAEAADVVLTHANLQGILTLLDLSDAVAQRIRANFAWSAVYNLVAILLAAGAAVNVRIPPAYAGLGEAVSVVPVVLVALQLKWWRPRV